MADTRREVSGAVIRGTIKWIEGAGLTAQVEPLVSPETRAMMRRPPLTIAWVPGLHEDELLEALEKVAGPAKVVTFGLESTRASFGPVLRPILSTLTTMFGATPASLFSKLNSVTGMMLKGVDFEWTAEGTDRGTVIVRTVDVPKVAWLRSWAGILAHGFDLTDTAGIVGDWKTLPDGKGASFPVSWTRKRTR